MKPIRNWVTLQKRNFIDNMKGFLSLIAMAVVYLSTAIAAMAQPDCFISSPNGITEVHILTMDGKAYYTVNQMV